MKFIKYKLIAIADTKEILLKIFNLFDEIKTLIKTLPGKLEDNLSFITALFATDVKFSPNSTKILSTNIFEIEDLTARLGSDFKFPANLRLTWNEYFMSIAILVSLRSSCYARDTGALFVLNGKNIVSAGYNGAPHEKPSCMHEGACTKEKVRQAKIFELILHNQPLNKPNVKNILVDSNESCPSNCAERNAITQLPEIKKGDELTAYCTLFPCSKCAEALLNVPGLKTVYYANTYSSSTGTPEKELQTIESFRQAGINLLPLRLTPNTYTLQMFKLIHPDISAPKIKPFTGIPDRLRNELGL